MIEVRELDPHDEKLFDAWYEVVRASAVEGREAAIVVSREAMAYSLRNPHPLRVRVPVAAFDGGRVVGAMSFDYRIEDNLDTVDVGIEVVPDQRRRGIGTALWRWALERTRELGRSIVQAELPVAGDPATWPGSVFAAKLGFVVEHVEDHLVVELPYDQERLDRIRANAGELTGYRLTAWAGVCPPEHEEAYADLHTAMERDVPSGGMTRELVPWTVEKLRYDEERIDQNWLPLVVMAHTLDGEPAGYTRIYLPRKDPVHAQQDDTLVLPNHRGHNLGTHLKLANLNQLANHRTTQRWLHTWTALTNTPMQKVNKRFGFHQTELSQELELHL